MDKREMESGTSAVVGSFGDSDDRFSDLFAPDFSRPPPNMEQNFSTASSTTTTTASSSSSSTSVPNRMPPPSQPLKFRPTFRPQHNNNMLNNLPDDFDGKRLRKTTMRKTVDYNASIIKALQNRVWQRDHRDRHALQPDVLYLPEVLPPPGYKDNAINAVTTRFVKTATNKMRCPIFCMAWTPEGRRLVTGASSGEFTLWNGLTFNFETILQAHDSPVRSMVWSNNDAWMITGDHSGYSKYWQSNMNNVKMFQAHKEAIRGLSFSPTDQKLVSCSDDGTLRIWDFARCHEEKVLRGHGSDVKCCDWHPQLGLIASGSKDNQQPIKLWEPKTGQCLTTLHAHKSTVMDLKWNKNGNWFVTASRDHFLKLFDVRNLSQVVQTFRGHKKEASCLAWHPHHEGLIASGGSDGAILFWHVGADKEVGAIDSAHESIVWTLDWHPLGHILCSGSNDHTSKFWTRNRPGDLMRDKYNLNTLPPTLPGMEDNDMEDSDTIPGMAPEDRVEVPTTTDTLSLFKDESTEAVIPGLEDDFMDPELKKKKSTKKQPYAKPIPKNFVAQWNETGLTAEEEEEASEGYGSESVLDPINQIINKFIEQQPGVKKLEELEPTAVVVFGKVLQVRPGQRLYKKIFKGREALNKYILSGKIKELQDVLPIDSEVCPTESDSDSSSMEVDPPNDEDETRSLTNYVTTSVSDLFRKEDVDFRRFAKDHKESDEDLRVFAMPRPGLVPLDQEVPSGNMRFLTKDLEPLPNSQVMDEDLRPLQIRPPPPLMPPVYRYETEDELLRREKMMMGDLRPQDGPMMRDIDFRSQFGGNFRNDFQGRNMDPRNNFHSRNSYSSRDVDFRDFDDRNRDQYHPSDMDFRGRDFDQRHCDYDERENYDMRGAKDGNFDNPNFGDRSNFNGNNPFSQNGRWSEGPPPPPPDGNWPPRPPPLMAGPNWDKDDGDYRGYSNRSYSSGQSLINNYGSRKMRGGRNLHGPRARIRRGRGRYPKN